jgi:ParB-like chromosome segregation protein Spo0J
MENGGLTMSNLSDRIALLLRSEASSEVLARVIEEAQEELASLAEACEDAKERVLDPHSPPSVVAKAKKDLEDSTLQASRLEAALNRLSEQLETARHREKEAGRIKRYEEAKAERDALTDEFQKTYSELAEQIATMLKHIADVDAKVAAVNRDLPENASYLYPIEQTIKTGLGWRVAEAVKLPALWRAEVPEPLRVAPGQVQYWPMSRGF